MDKKTKEIIETGKAKIKARLQIVENYLKKSTKKYKTTKNPLVNLT